MRLVKRVVIRNFRSIRRVVFDDLDEYIALVGLNSTGKSNVLRALSLFFNGYLDESRTPVDLARDMPDFANSKARKEIAVTVTLDLTSASYKVPKTKDFIAANGIHGQLVIERRWNLASNGVDVQEVFRHGSSSNTLVDTPEKDRPAVLSFIRAIQFRYVPNHVRPADIIRTELQTLRSALVQRSSGTKEFKEGGIDQAMAALSRTAETMFKPLSGVIEEATSGRSVRPDLPNNFADLVFQVGVSAVTEGGRVQPTEVQGSGTQSFLLLHVLDLLDSTLRHRGFGWRQANIWAIEEPESFLHAGLRTRFASDLRKYAADKRRQVIVTTHQDEFVRVSDHAWMATLESDETKVKRMDVRDALIESSKQRITAFSHPLLELPDVPMLVVEGKLDAVHLRAAMVSTGLRPRWRLICLEEIDDFGGGGTAVQNYLQGNRSVLRSRPDTAPVFVLRDWDEQDHVMKSLAKSLEVHPYSSCLRCPVDMANPKLGPKFGGIERYLPLDLVEKILKPGEMLPKSVADRYPIGVDKNVFNAKKAAFAKAVRDGHPPGEYLENLLHWVDEQVRGTFGAMPLDLFA